MVGFLVTVLLLRNPFEISDLSYSGITEHFQGYGNVAGVPKLPHTRKLCSETEWTEGLSIWCHSACGNNRKSFCGGLTNARSRLQTCVRWAIDVGATEIIVPHVVGRRANFQVDAFGGLICSDEWMDLSRLNDTLQANCPRLRVRTCPSDVDQGVHVIEGGRGWNQLDIEGSYKGSFHSMIDSTLKKENLDFASISAVEPVLLRWGDSYLGWNYSASGELGTIQSELFRAINYEPTLLEMGNVILRSPKLRSGAFIGVHFRGEADWPGSWGSADDQIKLYTAEMQRIRSTKEGKNVKDVYVSCGDKKAIERFREHLTPLGFDVHDKSTLLEDDQEMLARVEGLYFDMKAVVDYQLLSNAKYFMGVSYDLGWNSSFKSCSQWTCAFTNAILMQVFASSFSLFVAYARSVDGHEDLFEKYVHQNSYVEVKSGLPLRMWHTSPGMQGNEYTKLMVKSERLNQMAIFP